MGQRSECAADSGLSGMVAVLISAEQNFGGLENTEVCGMGCAALYMSKIMIYQTSNHLVYIPQTWH